MSDLVTPAGITLIDQEEGEALYKKLVEFVNAQPSNPRTLIIATTQLFIDAYVATKADRPVSVYLRQLAEIYKRQGL